MRAPKRDGVIYENPGIPMLADRIRVICKMNGTITETADLMGIGKSRVQSWCSGRCEPSAIHLAKLARLGNVSVDWLISDRRDGAQEMQWVEIRKGFDALMRNVTAYAAAEAKYHQPAVKRKKDQL